MNPLLNSLWAVAMISMIGLASGCSNQPSNQEAATNQTHGHSHEDGHTHEDGHSHEEGHSHGAGPHDGTLADWGGGEYHVEFTVDHDQQQATVYILGADAKTTSPIAAEEIQLAIKDPEMQVTLKAAPQEGDPEGSASRFSGNHENLGVVQEYEGTITGLVDDTPYSGNFKEEPHTHEQ